MFWIVQKTHPKPENYVPIFCRSSVHERFYDKENFLIFESKEQAIDFARKLITRFGIPNIRIFEEDGVSKVWKGPKT